jgi:protein phosphatase 2C family protein 2/3
VSCILCAGVGDLKYKGNPLLKAEDQMITAEPDVTCHLLTPQDEFFLLACDGVWDCNTNQQVPHTSTHTLG